MCDETKTTEKQYLAPGFDGLFFESIARGAIDWRLEGLVDFTCMYFLPCFASVLLTYVL